MAKQIKEGIAETLRNPRLGFIELAAITVTILAIASL